MEITILCSNKNHPVFPHLLRWKSQNLNSNDISIVNKTSDVKNGDILFLIACSEIIHDEIKNNFKKFYVSMKVIYLKVRVGLLVYIIF